MNVTVLVAAGFVIFSGYMLVFSVRNYRRAVVSDSWCAVAGILTKVKLWGTRNVNGQMQAVEKLSVAYDYEVQGQAYTGTAVAFYTLVYPETVDFAVKHPQGSDVQVYYCCDNPAESVLITGLKPGNKAYSEIILAGVALLVAVVVLTALVLGVI